MKRCGWCEGHDIYIDYHDKEWGVPVHDDRHLFEMLNLEGAQAGLSWLTILQKREGYRLLFDNFEAEKIIKYKAKKIEALRQDARIVRNKLKINAVIENAKQYLNIQNEYGSFDAYIWQFVDGEPIQNKFKTLKDVPATSKESDIMSKDLKKKGFKFVGSTICYAYMQAVGMVNDHVTSCFRYKEVKK